MPEHMIPITASKRPIMPDAKLLGKSDPGQKILLTIYVRQNPHPDTAALTKVDALSTELPGERKYLDDTQFNSVFGADPADLETVASWAKAKRLHVVSTSVPKRQVVVEGAIADVQTAFGVQLNEYEHPKHGHFRGRTSEIQVPESLFGTIEGVFGLDTRRVGKPRHRRGRLGPVEFGKLSEKHTRKASENHTLPDISKQFPGAFFPPEVAALYNYPSNLDGSGQNVAVFAFNGQPDPDPHGGYSKTALQTYYEKVLGGTTPKITDVVVSGPGNNPGPDTQASGSQGDSTGEVMLDMCVVGSVAPGANMFMYFTEFTSRGWVDALHEAIMDQNKISVISISYGNPEDDPQGAWSKMGVQIVNQAFQAAAAKGITICCASGDDGSTDQSSIGGAHVDFPASSPFVLGVGGTKLVAADDLSTIVSETVWNEDLKGEGATGGGVSSVFTRPAYQNNANVPSSVNPPHHIGRGVPDVAAVADPETGVVVMRIDGKHLESIGGTSAAAPLWAALIARLNQGLGARCGFLNPLLYTKLSTGILNDVVDGNNGAYAAAAGWDPCTGFGSPDGQRMLAALSSTKSATSGKKS